MSAPSQNVLTNRKALRDYFLEEKYECGIELEGCEVKSIRSGHVNFKDAFARVEKGQVYLYNLHIEPYPQGFQNPEADRVRRLLLHKREIRKLEAAVTQKGLALVPIKLYLNKRGLVKLELALGRGKKFYDKRETIKKRKIDRDLSRALRNANKKR